MSACKLKYTRPRTTCLQPTHVSVDPILLPSEWSQFWPNLCNVIRLSQLNALPLGTGNAKVILSLQADFSNNKKAGMGLRTAAGWPRFNGRRGWYCRVRGYLGNCPRVLASKRRKRKRVYGASPHTISLKLRHYGFGEALETMCRHPFGMVVKAVALQTVHELLRVVFSARNTRRTGVAVLYEHYKWSNAATQPLHQGGPSLC